MKRIKKIEQYELNELNDERLYINKYDMDLKYLYELNLYWKEFALDLLDKFYADDLVELIKNEITGNLLTFIKNNYKMLIEKYHLNIDFKDYVELNDYITLKEWLDGKDNETHFIEQNENDIYLSIE